MDNRASFFFLFLLLCLLLFSFASSFAFGFPSRNAPSGPPTSIAFFSYSVSWRCTTGQDIHPNDGRCRLSLSSSTWDRIGPSVLGNKAHVVLEQPSRFRNPPGLYFAVLYPTAKCTKVLLSELGGRVSLYRAPEPCTMQYKQGTFSNFYPRGRYRSAKWEEGRGLTLPERA